ncbi:MAG: hypothetical protein QF659_05750, partial [Dehalococcoidia bacterium]|nr:hypothetical protein [Dehalococcoidia bacterium]
VREKAKEVAAANLLREQQGQQQTHDALLKRKEQQEERLTTLEDALLDRLIQPGRYTVRRDGIMAELREIEQALSQVAVAPRPEYDELFTILDSITWDGLDDEGWRELLETVVDRVVITHREVTIDWLPICEPLQAVSAFL